jgi:hypothetical protein
MVGAGTTARISIAEIVTLSVLATMAIVKVGPVVVTVKVVVYATFLPPLKATTSRLVIFVPATVTSKTRKLVDIQLKNDNKDVRNTRTYKERHSACPATY